MALQIVGGILTATSGQSQILSGIAQIAIAVAVIGLLWSAPGKEFFQY